MANGSPPPLPAVRPERPPYIEAFERFTHGKDDQIEAFVAFGLFVLSDYTWAVKQPVWPSDESIRASYNRLLHDSEAKKTEDAAKRIVDEHREKLVRDHETKYLEEMFRQIEGRVEAISHAAARKHFLRGVLEATTGAFCWMLISLAIAVGASLIGIDLLHGLASITHKQASSLPAPPVPAPRP